MVCLRLARCQALPMHAPAEPPRSENQCLRRYSHAAPGVLGGDSSPYITSQWLKCLAHITCAHGQALVPIHQPAVLAWHHTGDSRLHGPSVPKWGGRCQLGVMACQGEAIAWNMGASSRIPHWALRSNVWRPPNGMFASHHVPSTPRARSNIAPSQRESMFGALLRHCTGRAPG